MDEERLREIERRHERARPPGAFTATEDAAQLWFRDLPELIAEVRRHRQLLEDYREECYRDERNMLRLCGDESPIWQRASGRLDALDTLGERLYEEGE